MVCCKYLANNFKCVIVRSVCPFIMNLNCLSASVESFINLVLSSVQAYKAISCSTCSLLADLVNQILKYRIKPVH